MSRPRHFSFGRFLPGHICIDVVGCGWSTSAVLYQPAAAGKTPFSMTMSSHSCSPTAPTGLATSASSRTGKLRDPSHQLISPAPSEYPKLAENEAKCFTIAGASKPRIDRGQHPATGRRRASPSPSPPAMPPSAEPGSRRSLPQCPRSGTGSAPPARTTRATLLRRTGFIGRARGSRAHRRRSSRSTGTPHKW